MVLVQFEVVLYFWLGLVKIGLDWFGGVFVKREKCWVFKGNAFKTPILVLAID